MARTKAECAALARAARKIPPLEVRFWSKVHILGPDVCWLWKAAPRNKNEGYGAFFFEGRHQPAGRIAWMLSTGQRVPAGMVVCHKCDIPGCCNPSHLFIGTPRDNDADRIAKGRQCKGSQQKNAVLTEELVARLRARASEVGPSQTAQEFGLNIGTLTDALHRRWRHVPVVYSGRRHMVTIEGKTVNLKEASKIVGPPYKTVYSRIKNGWDRDRALSVPVGGFKCA